MALPVIALARVFLRVASPASKVGGFPFAQTLRWFQVSDASTLGQVRCRTEPL
jgi:hypothetical protein